LLLYLFIRVSLICGTCEGSVKLKCWHCGCDACPNPNLPLYKTFSHPNRHPKQLFSVSQNYTYQNSFSFSPKSPCTFSSSPSSSSPPSSSSYPSSNGGTTTTTKSSPLAPWGGPTLEKPSNSTLKTQTPSSLTAKIGTCVVEHVYAFVNIYMLVVHVNMCMCLYYKTRVREELACCESAFECV